MINENHQFYHSEDRKIVPLLYKGKQVGGATVELSADGATITDKNILRLLRGNRSNCTSEFAPQDCDEVIFNFVPFKIKNEQLNLPGKENAVSDHTECLTASFNYSCNVNCPSCGVEVNVKEHTEDDTILSRVGEGVNIPIDCEECGHHFIVNYIEY